MLQNIYNKIFPPTCVLCDDATGTGLDLCQSCFLSLPHNHHSCHTCALPLPQSDHPDGPIQCGRCLADAPPVHATYAPYRYEAPADYMVQQLKFQNLSKFGRLMGELLANAVAGTPRPDLLLPVPQHEARLLDRGFNHAGVIAKTIGRRLELPVDSRLASKADARPPQSGLNARARQQNMRNAFCINEPLNAVHVAIVDDVLTTGATSEALATALKKAGCRRVTVWAFARTAR